MTRQEVELTFEHDIERVNLEELAALTHLSVDPGFAREAGDEFITAVAVVGLHRVLT